MNYSNGDKSIYPTASGSSDALTKREYFAGLAMQGLLAGFDPDGIISYVGVADDAVRSADALLSELERQK